MFRPDPNDLFQAYPFSEWHEDIGDVLWWHTPVNEPPYVGSPLDRGQRLKVSTQVTDLGGNHYAATGRSFDVGGWPFAGCEDHLVWTLLPGAIRMPK